VSEGQYRWVQETPTMWLLVDASDRFIRQVLERGPFLGQPGVRYRVLRSDREGYTDHASLAEAQQAALDSL